MVEFDQFKNGSGKNSFVLAPTKWIEKTHAIGMKTKSGKYNGGTFAHSDIALKFAPWIALKMRSLLV